MNKSNNTASSGGIGVLGVLQIIFVVLKILNIIDWSWWAVLIPTFIGLGITVLILVVVFVIVLISNKKGYSQMTKDEYIKTIVFNGITINIGLDDYGQTYFIEYIENGELKEECIGSYIVDYDDYIEWRFGDPEINCPIYNNVVTTDVECCTNQTKSLCSKCRKSWNNIDYAAWQKRQEEFKKWLEENPNV